MPPTTSEPTRAFVWIWLPGAGEPVVAGLLEERDGQVGFRYGRSYLDRPDAISLYAPELPLQRGLQRPLPGLEAPGCILDGRPDAWGQRVIMNRLIGRRSASTDPGELSTLTYLLESGSDRVGALDFQASGEVYEPRTRKVATLDELATSAERVQAGIPLTPDLDAALLQGSSVGGARPKAVVADGATEYIAKFSATDDTYAVVQAEYVAMRLAERAGLRTAPVRLERALGKHVLLVERFDRVAGTARRRALVSALTTLGLHEIAARHASYFDFAQVLRQLAGHARDTLRELFARITFNILVGNTDDHARNHAAFWDGAQLTLTPAYDICPQLRRGGEATQAMIIGDHTDPWKFSQVAGCVERAHLYKVTAADARDIVDRQIAVIRDGWDEICDEAQMTPVDRAALWQSTILNPYALQGYKP